MKTIWRFDFEVADDVYLDMPAPARILRHVHAIDPAQLTVWAEVTIGAPTVQRHLAVVGTGNPYPIGLGEHIGTAVAAPFVWHVYEVSA